VLAVARRLGIANSPLSVGYVGGTFRAGELLLGPMRETVKRQVAGADVHPPLRKPVEGAAMMAVHAAANPRPSRPSAL
jgi:hypothetical protein